MKRRRYGFLRAALAAGCAGGMMMSCHAQTPDEDIFIEAESSPRTDFQVTAPTEFPGLLSGDSMLRVFTTEEKAGGYHAEFPFTVKHPNRFSLWVGVSLPPETSNFWWRVDGGAWNHVTSESEGGTAVNFGVSRALSWMRLSTQALKAGPHTLQIRLDERRSHAERAFLMYLDAILITSREVAPLGLVRPQDVASLQPLKPIVPVARPVKGGPRATLGGSIVVSPRQNRQLVKLGFSLLQTDSEHLTVNQTAPGVWDWTIVDGGLAAARAAGAKWQYFPHFSWPPKWYRESEKFVPLIGLQTHTKLASISLWSPDILRFYEEGYAALAQHLKNDPNAVAAIYLGIYGDFGETIFPMGAHPDGVKVLGPEGTGTGDFWCGDDYARADFRRYALAKYGTLQKINAAWHREYSQESAIDYPAGAYNRSAVDPRKVTERRHWLDFTAWYNESMAKFSGEVARIARHYFPKAMLQLPIGGGNENVYYAQDASILAKAVKPYGVHLRSTHGGFQPFAVNEAGMLKRISTAAHFYGEPHWLEPPSNTTIPEEIGRFMEQISTGSDGYWSWSANPLNHGELFDEYRHYLTRETPQVDVALFFPTADHRLHAATTIYPPRLHAMGATLRDVMDFDSLDETLLAAGAAKKYRVVLWPEGDIVEKATLQNLAKWVQEGGTVLRFGDALPQTVEGETAESAALFGYDNATAGAPRESAIRVAKAEYSKHLAAVEKGQIAPPPVALRVGTRVLADVAGAPLLVARSQGRGHVLSFLTADSEYSRRAFYEAARDTVYRLSRLDKTKRDAVAIDNRWDGVYAVKLAGEAVFYNPTSAAKTVEAGGQTLPVPPVSIRSLALKNLARK